MRLILAIWLCLSAVAAPPLFRAQNVPGGGFLPSDLPDLALWLDADDASTLTLSGSVVDEWRDKSGNGRDFTGSGSARPALVSAAYNGRDAIQFDGVNDQLTLGSSGLGRNVDAVTVYVSVRWVAVPTSTKCFYNTSTGTSSALTRFSIYAGITSGRMQPFSRRLDADSSVSHVGSAALTTSWASVAFVCGYSSGDRYGYIDGLLDSSTSGLASGLTSNTDSLETAIGADSNSGSFANVEITEILVYHSAHDAATRAQVEAYLTR